MADAVTKNLDEADVRDWGARSGVESTAEIQQAIDDTGRLGKRLRFPDGRWVASNLELTGRAQLRGYGDVSVIEQADGATGELLKLPRIGVQGGPGTYDFPLNFIERRDAVYDLAFRGNGSADPTNIGINVDYAIGLRFGNLSFRDFGGQGMALNDWFVECEMERVTFGRPVDANVNGVPYFSAAGIINGSNFHRLGFRSLNQGPDSTNVVRWREATSNINQPNFAYVPELNELTGWWCQSMNTPENGTIFDMSMARTHFEMPQIWDSRTTTPNTTNTSQILMRPRQGGLLENGGNYLWGRIPGGHINPDWYAYGIDMRQSKNHVQGIRGWRDSNILLRPGVHMTHILLGGQQAGQDDPSVYTNPLPAVIDNSGETSNTIIDTSSMDSQFLLASHTPFQMYDTTGAIRTLQQPTGPGPGPATWS